mmetsp:Transcript_28965/g.85682  ORF Transcript_28965/g.85682 Transcript_28965/m.85682 type:complete len:366 (+) Transcript_28965:497-1594(+)
MLQDIPHRIDTLVGVVVQQLCHKVLRHGVLVVDHLQGLLQALLVPSTDLGHLIRAHRALAPTGVWREGDAGDSLIQDDAVRPNIVGRRGGDRNDTGRDGLLPHRRPLDLHHDRLGRVIEAPVGVGRLADRDGPPDTEELPPAPELPNVVRTEVAVDEAVLVHVQEGDTDPLERLRREGLPRLSHVQHEVLGRGVCPLHGDAVPRLGHRLGVRGVLDGVVDADDRGNVVAGKVILLPDLELPLNDVRPGRELRNDLLPLLLPDLAELVLDTLLRTAADGRADAVPRHGRRLRRVVEVLDVVVTVVVLILVQDGEGAALLVRGLISECVEDLRVAKGVGVGRPLVDYLKGVKEAEHDPQLVLADGRG